MTSLTIYMCSYMVSDIRVVRDHLVMSLGGSTPLFTLAGGQSELSFDESSRCVGSIFFYAGQWSSFIVTDVDLYH